MYNLHDFDQDNMTAPLRNKLRLMILIESTHGLLPPKQFMITCSHHTTISIFLSTTIYILLYGREFKKDNRRYLFSLLFSEKSR